MSCGRKPACRRGRPTTGPVPGPMGRPPAPAGVPTSNHRRISGMTGTPRRVGRPGGSSVPVQQTLSEARVRRCREIPCGTGVNGCYENFHIHTVKPEAPRRVQRVGRPRAFDAGGSATGGAFTAHIGGLRSDSGIPGSPSSNNVAGRSTSGGSIAPHCCVTAGRQVNTVHRFPAARGTPPGSMAPVPMASRVLHLFYICAVTRTVFRPSCTRTLLCPDLVLGSSVGPWQGTDRPGGSHDADTAECRGRRCRAASASSFVMVHVRA